MLCADVGKNSTSIINCERKANVTIGNKTLNHIINEDFATFVDNSL